MNTASIGILLVRIPLQDIYNEVDIRTYYQGEMLKRKDIDMSGIQTSSDDRDVLRGFVETAVNNVAGRMMKRVLDVKWGIISASEASPECISFDIVPYKRIPEKDAGRVAALLRKAVFDYIVNCCVCEWLMVVRPELAVVSERNSELLMWKVMKYIGMLSGMVRRRATDLGGV